MDQFKQQVEQLVKNLEKTTGKKYQLTIDEFGSNERGNYICPFDKRKVKVTFDRQFLQNELDKINFRREEFKKRYQQFNNKAIFNDSSSNMEISLYQSYIDNLSEYIKLNGEHDSLMEVQRKIKEYNQGNKLWDYVNIDETSGDIYHSYGGISISYPIGKFELV